MATLSIVVPAYNEEGQIQDVVRTLVGSRPRILGETDLSDVEILVVNDGSIDATASLLEEMQGALADGSFRVLTHGTNCGYGAALKTGFREARGEYLSFMDADGTLHPESFIAMYRSLRERDADIVVGGRFGQGDSEMPWVRKMGNRFFALFLSFLSGTRVGDTASGMRLFRKNVVPLLYALPDGLHFTPAMSTKTIHEKLKIVEIPIPYAERGGESKLRVVSDGLRFLRIILGTVLMYNPFKVFLLVGLLFEAVAATLMAAPIQAILTGQPIRFADYIYRSIGAMYLFTAGIQIVLFGILARFIVSTFFREHETGRWIHRINRTVRVYERMGFYGLGVLGGGVFVNGLYFWKYLFGGGLDMHWSWLLFSAGFIIVGVQMIITGVVMRILRDIRLALKSE